MLNVVKGNVAAHGDDVSSGLTHSWTTVTAAAAVDANRQSLSIAVTLGSSFVIECSKSCFHF